MTPADLDQYLACMQRRNVMSGHLKTADFEMTVTLSPAFEATDDAPKAPGGWKTEVSDPDDPDPLGLGNLDAPIAFEDPEVAL